MIVTIQDAGDGSGDGFLPIPDEILAQCGWKEGDVLDARISESGYLVISKVEAASSSSPK